MTQGWLAVGSVKPCGCCHRVSRIESRVQAMVWGDPVPVLVQEPESPPVWGVDTGRCGATSGAEFGAGATLRKGIPRRIGESRGFGSFQSELRPNQNWPCMEVQMGESGLSASTKEESPA